MIIFNRRRRIAQDNSNEVTTLLMNLSLFIMLLAFFIVLNAISSFEQVKSKDVMESLEEAFGTKVQREDVAPSTKENPMQDVLEGETVDRINALFKAQITSFDKKIKRSTGEMIIDLDLAEFTEGVMAIGQRNLTAVNAYDPPKRFFLPTLISIMQSDQEGYTYRMDMVLHTDDSPAEVQNEKPAVMKETIDKGGQLARRLENVGLSKRLMSIGVSEGDPEKITLYFRRHTPFSPVKKTEAEEEQPQVEGEAAPVEPAPRGGVNDE